jgi:pyruvate dehydrogenase E2 component (dihydrolipoamide acetyltransferase)
MTEFLMPSLGADMDEGTVLEWLVEPGDVVAKGDLVAVVDTSKAAVDIETFQGGVVQEILVPPGQKVPVGTPLALLAAPGETAPAAAARQPEETAPAAAREPEEHLASPVVRRFARSSGVDLAGVHGTGAHGRITHQDVQRAADTTGSRRRVSPYARRRARELGVDPADLTALGSPGPVSAADVEAAAAARPDVTPPSAATRTAAPTAPAATAAAAAADRTAAKRRAIATLMARSKREIPHYYLTETFDLSAAQAWLRDHNAGRPVGDRLVMAALLAKATALAARQVPAVNGYWEDDAFRPAESVHLGIAVSLRGGGLVTPAIHDAADLALPDLMAALRDVVERARRGVLHRAELTDGTLTMTNLGERGAESVLGVIFPPQVALVGFGRVVERAVAVDGLVGARPTVRASLSGDHRAGDGHVGGTYLAAIGEMLERPEDL